MKFKINELVYLKENCLHSPLHIHSGKIENNENLYLLKRYSELNLLGRTLKKLVYIWDKIFRKHTRFGFTRSKYIDILNCYMYNNPLRYYKFNIFQVGLMNLPRMDNWIQESKLLSIGERITIEEVAPCKEDSCEFVDSFLNG